MSKISLQEMETFLWNAIRALRKPGFLPFPYNPIKFQDYIFGILILKRLSDVFEEEQEQVFQYYLNAGKSQEDAERLASKEDQYIKTFFVPECSRWSNIKHLKHDIGSELNKAFEAIKYHNSSLKGELVHNSPLYGELVSIDTNIKNELSDKAIQRLLSHFSQYRMRNADFESSNILGNAYESMNEAFYDANRYVGEYSTSSSITQVMVSLLNPASDMKIYDPASGTGNIFHQVQNYLIKKSDTVKNLSIYGQEINTNTWARCKRNMLLNGIFDADIRNGDTLSDPQHISGSKLMQFDRVISNPPLGVRQSVDTVGDPYGRYPYGIPSKNAGDLAFIQHMIASLNAEGKMVTTISRGFLYSTQLSYQNIRKGIIEDDLIDAVVLLPQGLHLGTMIPPCILVINKNKSRERKNKILFIAADNLDFNPVKRIISEPDIEKIISSYENCKEEEGYSSHITLDQIRDSKYNLNNHLSEIQFNRDILSTTRSQYHDYKRYKLGDLSLDIKRLKESTETKDVDNRIFIPTIGQSDVVLRRKDSKLKFQNLYMVSLDEQLLRSKYICIFFNSEYGKRCIKTKSTESIIPHLNISSVSDILVSVPSLEIQDKIIENYKKLSYVKAKVNELEDGFSSNPIYDGQEESLTILDNLIYSIDNLDSIMSPDLPEESKIYEYKASFKTPYPDFPEKFIDENGQEKYKFDKDELSKKQVHKKLEYMVLKAVNSLVNTHGGTLVIGVHEYGNEKSVVGIDREGFPSHDHYIRAIDQALKDVYGNILVAQYITCKIKYIDGLPCCYIECKDTPETCLLYERAFVRTGPRVDELLPSEIIKLSQIKSMKKKQ